MFLEKAMNMFVDVCVIEVESLAAADVMDDLLDEAEFENV